MSTSRSKLIKYNCWFDHGLGVPCDGHTLQIEYHHTSDTVSVIIDDNVRMTVDQGGWDALLEAIKDDNK